MHELFGRKCAPCCNWQGDTAWLSAQVSMAPHVLKRPVNVFSGQQQVGTYEPGGKQTSKQPVNLLYDGIGHYDLLVQHRPTSRL